MKQVVLYNHNKTTYENIVRIFENDNKCAAVQPTGSGKSFLIFKLAQDNSDKTIVVFEPNKQIIGRVSEQMKEYGIENIKFYTYQKLNSQHKRDEISIENVDYICLDELHRIKAKQWGQAVEAIQDKFPNAKVLGLTATPERMDGQNIIDYFGAELACNITLGDAIVNKILPCPTYISALYTFDEEFQRVYDKINESKNSDEEKEEMRAELETARKQLENALGVPKILEKHIPDKNGKYIVFCQNVEHLNTMQSVIEDWFVNAGFEIHTYAVHTKNPNRKTEYKAFQTDNADCIKLCLCVDMFNEGVHLEGITGVILLRPTQSSIVYLQQIGRAISASDENTPIIFDLVNNSNCIGSVNLRTEIEDAVDRQRDNKKQNKDKDTDIFDIGDFHIYDYITESLNIFSNIENKCSNEFNFRLKQLAEYKAKWGHCCVMKEEAQEWEGLNRWAINQRQQYKLCSLSQNRIISLNKYDFIWDVSDWQFNILLKHIEQYIKNGNKIPIPTKYVCEDGFKLGSYIYHLRIKKKDGSINKDIEKEICKLNSNLIAPIKDINSIPWMEMFNITKEFVELNSEPIALKTIYKGYKIGEWLLRNKFRYKKGKLTNDKENLLREICNLDSKSYLYDSMWNKNFELIEEYISLGNKITKNTIYKGLNLKTWYTNQIYLYKLNKLPTDRAKRMEMLVEKIKNNKQKRDEQKWDEFIKLLNNYLVYNTQILYNTVYEDVHIGRCLQNYKYLYKQGQFPKERYQQLLSLGIDLAKKRGLM